MRNAPGTSAPLHPAGGGGGGRRRTFRPRRWALLLLVVAGLLVAADLFLPAGPFPPRERRVVLVRRGQTLREVSNELARVGVLRGTLGFQVLARLMRLDRSIKAGQYSFRLGITVPALLRAFARGMSGLNLVTVPEGLTVGEISVILSNRLGQPISAFDSLAHDRMFLDSLGITAPSIEGYLAPESYQLLPGTSPEVAFRTMAARQRETLLKAAAGRDSLPLGLSLHNVLTLASIVESEAQLSDERARIARVYLNRLERGMRLQADPTVAYGLGMGPRSHLFLRQLKQNSPFNTYLFEGLPPGPICNPGVASIHAVLDPMPPDVRDLYFVARGQGRHLFSQTYEQHLKNIALVRSMQAMNASREELHPMLDTARTPARRDTLKPVPPAAPAKALSRDGAKPATRPEAKPAAGTAGAAATKAGAKADTAKARPKSTAAKTGTKTAPKTVAKADTAKTRPKATVAKAGAKKSAKADSAKAGRRKAAKKSGARADSSKAGSRSHSAS